MIVTISLLPKLYSNLIQKVVFFYVIIETRSGYDSNNIIIT